MQAQGFHFQYFFFIGTTLTESDLVAQFFFLGNIKEKLQSYLLYIYNLYLLFFSCC